MFEQISLDYLIFQSGRLTLERGLALHATKGWADAGVVHNGLNSCLVLTREADGRYDFLTCCRLGHDGRATVAYILMSPGQVSDTPFKGTPFLGGIHYYITFYRLQYAV